MKSKIEKLLKDIESNTLVKEVRLTRDSYGERLIRIKLFPNQPLNSQSQPEEKKQRVGCEYSDCYRCPECNDELLVTCLHPLELLCTRCREYVEIEDVVEKATYVCAKGEFEVKDTPEEWEETYRRDGALAFYIELEDWLYEKGYVKGEVIKVPTKAFMQFVARELKLNNKKK